MKSRINIQSLLTNHSKWIGEATEFISTLMRGQSETNARLNLLADSNGALEKNLPTLLAQMARLSADQAAEKSRLQRTTWAMGAMMLLLASTCVVLALRTGHLV